MGFEPTTLGTTNRCSNRLSYALQKNGGGAGIRTPGTLSGTAVFKTAAINRSATPPFFQFNHEPLFKCGAKVNPFF